MTDGVALRVSVNRISRISRETLREFFETRRVIEDYVLENYPAPHSTLSFWIENKVIESKVPFWRSLEGQESVSALTIGLIASVAKLDASDLKGGHPVLAEMLLTTAARLGELADGRSVEEIVAEEGQLCAD